MDWNNRLLFFVVRRVPWLVRLNFALLAALAHRNPDQSVKLIFWNLSDVDRAIISRPEIHDLFRQDIPEMFRQGALGLTHDLNLCARPWQIKDLLNQQ